MLTTFFSSDCAFLSSARISSSSFPSFAYPRREVGGASNYSHVLAWLCLPPEAPAVQERWALPWSGPQEWSVRHGELGWHSSDAVVWSRIHQDHLRKPVIEKSKNKHITGWFHNTKSDWFASLPSAFGWEDHVKPSLPKLLPLSSRPLSSQMEIVCNQ